MITKEQFFYNVDHLPKQIFSGKQQKMYTNIRRVKNICTGLRESGTKFEIDLDALYLAYTDNDKVKTSTVLEGGYVTGRWRSPSIAIMKYAGLIDENGNTNK